MHGSRNRGQEPCRLVLVVEDEYHIRRLLDDGLSAEGYDVRAASSAGEALSALSIRPHVVLLDIMLADVNGLELARQIRDMSPAPIIAMSASQSLLTLAKNMDYVDGILAKPFDWETLLGCIDGVSCPRAEGAERKQATCN